MKYFLAMLKYARNVLAMVKQCYHCVNTICNMLKHVSNVVKYGNSNVVKKLAKCYQHKMLKLACAKKENKK